MRDSGKPMQLNWRWAPCAALVLGSLSFVGFVTLVVPEQIGSVVEAGSTPRLGNALVRTRQPMLEAPRDEPAELSGEVTPDPSPTPPALEPVANHDPAPRRGFSPPLERPDPPPPPPPPPPQLAPPPPAPEPVPPPEAAPAPLPAAEVAPAPPPAAEEPSPERVASQPESEAPAAANATPAAQ